ncbi:ABC transporter substrate-binding protein [Salibaculum griseiflavum]|uniref:ABC transporter substrate-binding protein n=1 Tax=Salibaculum griseiflavum TaxID=1914409 RepID=A0A2V1P631_9RHOB|nr:ABC transporter substrate-binding protein [Salibaculum griseiflavum]PWG17260.1 ABC transporter substrate-binding protein [Salibaculum griseiflavum]
MNRRGSHIVTLFAGAVLVAAPVLAQDEAPQRVVSMNLCTDQLAMMLADEGQLYSVSYLSQQDRGSAMVEEARKYVPNRALAEEIYLMDPDLVIAGSFSARVTLDMLRRLDVPVVVFDPSSSLSDIPDRITQMGAVLHQQDKAARMVDEFNAALADLAAMAPHEGARPSAALYSANGWSSGSATLPGQIVAAAGFDLVADEYGMAWGGFLPLELLAMSDPNAVITGQPYPAASRAEEILDHPVVTDLKEGRMQGIVSDQDWSCGTPFVLGAIERLSTARQTATEAPQ